MKLFEQMQNEITLNKCTDRSYVVTFDQSFVSFYEALKLDGLVTEQMSTDADPQGIHITDCRLNGGVQIIIDRHYMFDRDKPFTVNVSGLKEYVDVVESVLKRYGQLLGEDIKPKQVKTEIEYHNKLNPKLWENGHNPEKAKLKSEVSKKLKEIADQFVEYLNLPDLEVKDVIVTGSNANFNWNPHSDIDVHVVVDMDQVKEQYGSIIEDFFETKRFYWNDQHDITIRKLPVELYVQGEDDLVATAVWSINDNKWVVQPKYTKPTVDSWEVKSKAADWINKIDNMSQHSRGDRADEMLSKLNRYRRAGLSSKGELSVENLVYKTLRNLGYIEQLAKYRSDEFDRQLSIEDEEWWKG